ncbi:MAG TPA: peptidylprolyl isomerase [Flavisolibacter sp.]|jgi:peptidyl-prolyl cis-trans isomerase D|nr:peptidylprolyl isomerase [Flavisolibacter sp.]
MSVIQKIRDKYARWAVIAIAVSLLGFILMDAFAGRTGMFGSGRNNAVGKINGTKINYTDFAKKVEAAEAYQKNQGYEVGEANRQQIVETVWEQEISNVLMEDQYEDLGLEVSEKELKDILFGANPPQDIKQAFTDPQTGVFNAVRAQQEINNLRKKGDPAQQEQFNQYFEALKKDRMMSKYTTLLMNTIHFPKWFLEKRNADNSLMARVSYVSVPYATISDSSVKVSDKDLEDYISAHKKDFEQKEETRGISYVLFPATPSKTDTANTLSALNALKPQFDTTTQYETFVNRNSALPFFNGYLSKTALQQPNKDSILAQPTGVVYGPYLDASGGDQSQSLYVLSKIIDVKSLPDSVKCRHILISTVNPQTGQPLGSDSVAKAKADSIALAIRGGASFDSLEAKYSSDEQAHKEKGVMTFSSTQIQSEGFAKEFGQFILFDGKVGDKKVVKTQFGYHYIEIMEQRNVGPHYKIAYLGKPIQASSETDNAASSAASMFAGDSRDEKSFNANWEKNLKPKGVNKLTAIDIAPLANSINGINGTNRKFIKDIYAADKGDIVGPERVGDNYVVAIVTDVNKAGLAAASRVRPYIESILRNKKKAEQIKKAIGTVSSLEAVAQKYNQGVQTLDSLRFSGGNNVLGYESRVLGAAFNPANKGKVCPEPIEGQAGVYVLRVDNISTTPVETANIEEQRKMLEQQARQGITSRMSYGGGNPFVEALKRSAKINDYRADFY